MPAIRYYVGRLCVEHAAVSTTETVRFALAVRKSPVAHMRRLAATWFLSKPIADDGSYLYFNGAVLGAVCVTVDNVVEVSKTTYEELRGVVSEMSTL